MGRIVIDLPERFGFSTEIPIYSQHINYGNHLDNAQMLSLVSEARVRYLKSMGYTDQDVEGNWAVVTDAAIRYRSEAFHGETLVFEMDAADFNKYGCDVVYRVSDKASGRLVAEGKTGILIFDPGQRRPVEVPAEFRRRAGG